MIRKTKIISYLTYHQKIGSKYLRTYHYHEDLQSTPENLDPVLEQILVQSRLLIP